MRGGSLSLQLTLVVLPTRLPCPGGSNKKRGGKGCCLYPTARKKRSKVVWESLDGATFVCIHLLRSLFDLVKMAVVETIGYDNIFIPSLTPVLTPSLLGSAQNLKKSEMSNMISIPMPLTS